MLNKNFLRKKYLSIRKKKHFNVKNNFLNPLSRFLKPKKNKKILLSIYYPANNEVDIIKLLKDKKYSKIKFLLPRVYLNQKIKFHSWKFNDPVEINKFGILEPLKTQKIYTPNIMLIPLLAYDKWRNRLGYGKGYYDRYLNHQNKKSKKIVKIGVAFSFQEFKKLPSNLSDVKLDFILTEKGLKP